MSYLSKTPNDTIHLGKEIAAKLSGGEVLCLYGELGSGKTTFTRGVINYFLPKKRVLSPTFIIVRHYQVNHKQIKVISHVDLYRIEKKEEIENLGLSEFINKSDSVVLIEWAEKLGKLSFDKRIDICFEKIDDNQRKISINYLSGKDTQGVTRLVHRSFSEGGRGSPDVKEYRNDLKQPIKILKQGGIVIFPTDTAYGIGCRMDDEDAVKRLFRIRKRPFSQATPVLVSSIEMAQNYLSPLSDNVRHLMRKYWPGALTIVYSCRIKKIPSPVRGGDNTLGVRMPRHELVLKLIKSIGVPILGPSANFHGKETPYQFEDLDPELVKLVDFVIEGKCQLGKVSTVIDCSVSPWKIIRQGAMNVDEID